jgi:hypothetical protein
MIASEILNQVGKDGVKIALSTSGKIKVIGEQKAVSFWVPLIRENKATLIELLKNYKVPIQCQECDAFETFSDMEPGCVVQLPEDSEWEDEWRRLKNVSRASSKSYPFLAKIIFLSMHRYIKLDSTSAKKDRVNLNGYISNTAVS